MARQQKARSELRAALADSRRTFVGLAIFSLVVSLLMLTGPLYMLQVYDRVLSSESVSTLVALTILVAVLYLTLGVIDWVRQSLFAVVSSRLEDRLADRVLSSSLAISLRDAGARNERPLQDLRTIRRFIASPALPAIFDAPWTPIFFVALFMMHWMFGAWALFGVIVLVTLALINQTVSRKALIAAEEEDRFAQQNASEMTRNVEVIEALGMRKGLEGRWRKRLDSADDASTSASRTVGGFTAGTKAFRLFLQSAILGLGAWLAIIDVSTPGAMIAASIIMGRAIAPIEQTVGQWRTVVAARQAWTSLKQALAVTPPREEPMALPPVKGEVRVENVHAGPPGARKPVLRQINMGIRAGEAVGVVGPSASGKSTFARVLVGLWPPLGGAVRLDGAELSSWSRDALGPQIGYLPQQVELFAGTVRDNIARFDETASPEAVIAAAQAAGCHDLILRLSDGYDTQIGEGGAYLSAGQRQRVALARALFGSPNLVVLDEPNSNLDGAGEEALQGAIAGIKARGGTTVIIAHRPNAIVHCDKLLVLENGEMRMFGLKDEVMTKLQAAQGSGRVTPIRKGETRG